MEKNTKISLNIGGIVTTAEIPGEDCTIDELMGAFAGCLVGQTFPMSVVVNGMADYAYEHQEYSKEVRKLFSGETDEFPEC